MSFLILSSARSRSYWLSQYLSYPPHSVGHDIILNCDTLAHFIREFTALSGSVELSVGLAWRYFMNMFPEVDIVTVRRPINEVYDSLRRIGLYTPVEMLQIRDKALRDCSQHPRVQSIEYRDLEDPDCCQWLFEHCLNQRWDEKWYKDLAKQNLQVPNIKQRAMLTSKRLNIMERILLETTSIAELKEYYAS